MNRRGAAGTASLPARPSRSRDEALEWPGEAGSHPLSRTGDGLGAPLPDSERCSLAPVARKDSRLASPVAGDGSD